MGNTHSRVAPKRSLLDSHTRARYKNHRELLVFRRKITDITTEHGEALASITTNRHEARVTWHEIQHEIKQKKLVKNPGKRFNQQSEVSFQNSDVLENCKLTCSSLLLHDLNASNNWERSTILPNIYEETINSSKPLRNLDSFILRYDLRVNDNSHLFERSKSSLTTKRFTLRQETERMKNSFRIAITKSKRDFGIAARRATQGY